MSMVSVIFLNTKICLGCKQEKPITAFFKNKTKSDGLQGYCKFCSKSKWGKWFDCSSCGEHFYVGHRNVSKRKTKLCRPCLKEIQIQQIIARNKASAGEFVLSQKGYSYIRDLTEKNGYKFLHRKIMEEHFGRSLSSSEIVHHVDGNKLNNVVENLFLTSKVGHAEAHNSLERVAFLLVRQGVIQFSKETGKYELLQTM